MAPVGGPVALAVAPADGPGVALLNSAAVSMPLLSVAPAVALLWPWRCSGFSRW